MEAKAEDLISALKNQNLSIETKLNFLLTLKSDIKQKVVPAYLTSSIFHGIRLAISSQHSPIYAAGFSTLSHLLKRLYLQEQHGDVAYYARDLYPILLERLGDHKERVRVLASDAFSDLWHAAHADVEKQVLGTALNGKNPKAKEMSMLWLARTVKEHGIFFRAYVPTLVMYLEDADSTIRETARSTVVELFKDAPSHAKRKLKKEMTERNVRKSIMRAILPLIGLDDEEPSQRSASRAETLKERPTSKAAHRATSEDPQQRPVSRAEPLQERQPRIDARTTPKPGNGTIEDTQRPVSRAEPLKEKPARIDEKPQTKSGHGAIEDTQRPVSRAEPLKEKPVRIDEETLSETGPLVLTEEEQGPPFVESRPDTPVFRELSCRVKHHLTSIMEEQPALEPHQASSVLRELSLRVKQDLIATAEGQPAVAAKPRSAFTMGELPRVDQHAPILLDLFDKITGFEVDREELLKVESELKSFVPKTAKKPKLPVQEQPISRKEKLSSAHINQRVYTQATAEEHSGGAKESATPKVEEYTVHSVRELETIIRDMTPCFEGRETEDNWYRRIQSVSTLRRLTAGNAPHDFSQAFIASIKSLLDGIFKVVNSLRTQLATTGCHFIQDLSTVCGSNIDGLVEPIMQNMLKICVGMKKITAGLGDTTVDIVLQNVSYNSRLLQHIAGSFDDKSMQLRLYAAGWLKTIIKKHALNKTALEHNGGLEVVIKSIRKGLADANPGVRESMRRTFWEFARVWPSRGNNLLNDFDNKTRSLLEKDPSNPGGKGAISHPASPSRRVPVTSVPTAGRSALKQAIAAQKRVQAQSAAPAPLPRPGSAHAVLGEPRTKKSTLSSAPVRRGVKVVRPATAEPGQRPGVRRLSPSPTLNKGSKYHSDLTLGEGKAAPFTAEGMFKDAGGTAPTPKKEHERDGNLSLDKGKAAPFTAEGMVNDARGTAPTHEKEHERDDDLSLDEDKAVPFTAEGMVNDAGGTAPTPEKEHERDDDLSLDEDKAEYFTAQETVNDAGGTTPTPEKEHERDDDLSLDEGNAVPFTAEGMVNDAGGTAPTPKKEHERDGDLSLDEDQAAPLTAEETVNDVGGTTPTPEKEHERDGDLSLDEDQAAPLTAEEMTLGNLHATAPRFRRRVHDAPLDENDPLTKRWQLVESDVAKRRNVSPRSEDVQYARTVIASARALIKEGKMGTVDVHAYRKVQSLIAYHNDIFTDEEDFKGFLSLLLEDLERKPEFGDDKKDMRVALDFKMQLLKTIRFMFVYDENSYADLHAKILMGLMQVRRYFEPRFYLITALNETADDLLYACDLSVLVAGMVENLNNLPDNAPNMQAAIMGVQYITKALRIMNKKQTQLNDKVLGEVGSYAAQCMSHGQPGVRRFVGDLCQQIRAMAATENHFWELLGYPTDGHVRNLVSYYIFKME